MKFNRITALLMLSSVSICAHAESYRVVELPTQDLSINQFATSIDNTGLMLSLVNQPYNRPIDLSLIDLTPFPLTDPDAAAQGNFNAIDLTIMTSFLYEQTAAANPFTQKLATRVSYSVLGSDVNYVSGLDVEDPNTDGFTFSQEMINGDSVNGSHIVGTMAGPYQQIPYTIDSGDELTFVLNEFSQRGFVQVGDNVSEIMPEFLEYGSVTEARAINDNLQVAGISAISYTEALETNIANCRDDDIRGDEPVESCLYALRFVTQAGTNLFRASMDTRAVIWQLDNNGAVIDKTVYGILFEPADDVTRIFTSQATDINNNGVAVGSSSAMAGEFFSDAAVAFENGELLRLIDDDDLLPNLATNINDNNFVVGFRGERINNIVRSKMFVLNRSNNELEFVDGFFRSSTTIPRAINNNNIVVGDAESEATNTNRRRAGFMYNIDTKEFSNLNDLIACDSPYSVIAGNDINDNDEIVADALVKRPARDVTGEVVNDANGEPLLIDTVVAIKLEPTGQAPTDCEPTEEELAVLERQGAGFGLVFSLFLLGLGILRRKSPKVLN